MNKPLDHETISKAMKKAAWVAKHGTREERSGRFIEPTSESRSDQDTKKSSHTDGSVGRR